jgi:hypothetical protein
MATEQPVDILITTAPGIGADDCPASKTGIQVQDLLGLCDQGLQTAIQLSLSRIEALNHNLVIQGGYHPSQLPTALILLLGEVTFFYPFSLPSGRQTTHIDIQQLPSFAVVMSVTLTILLINVSQGGPHLVHIFGTTRVQCVADGRLLSTMSAAESQRQTTIGPDPIVHFNQAMSASHDVDEGVLQFLKGCVGYHFLFYHNTLTDGFPDTHLLKTHASHGQTGSRRKSDNIVHGDRFPLASRFWLTLFLLGSLSLFFISFDWSHNWG